MIVKCRRREFVLDETDKIMYNGACYQIITKRYGQGFDQAIPVIAKAKAKKMIKEGSLVLDRVEKNTYLKNNLEYYKIGYKMDGKFKVKK